MWTWSYHIFFCSIQVCIPMLPVSIIFCIIYFPFWAPQTLHNLPLCSNSQSVWEVCQQSTGMTIGAGNWGIDSLTAALKQGDLGVGLGCELSKSFSSDVVPPARPLYVPNSNNSWGPHFQIPESIEDFSHPNHSSCIQFYLVRNLLNYSEKEALIS